MEIKQKVVYAVVVTYNGSQWIHKCIGSLKSSGHPVNVVVVDNGSTDGTKEIIQKEFSDVQLIVAEKNLGFGAANNVGIKKALDAAADYVLLLNQDAWVEKETVRELVAIQQQHTNYGIISPLHLNGQGDAFDKGFIKYSVSGTQFSLVDDLYFGSLKPLYDVPFVNAAAWLLSRACIQKVGGFDPLFFHYGEDLNYCQRVLFHGLSIGVATGARIFHDRETRGGVMRKEFAAENSARKALIAICNPMNNTKEEWRLFTNSFRKEAIVALLKASPKNFKALRRKKVWIASRKAEILAHIEKNIKGDMVWL